VLTDRALSKLGFQRWRRARRRTSTVRRRTRIDTLKTETAALKVTNRKELELEKRLSQSGEAVMWAELPKELLRMVLEKLLVSGLETPLAGGSKAPNTCAW
jgi:hypothetical protein